MPKPEQLRTPRGQRIAVFGATSEIGEHVARLLAPGNTMVLAGRRVEALQTTAAELRSAGADDVEVVFFEATDTAAQRDLIAQIQTGGPIDIALAMFGVLGDQAAAERDGEEVYRVLHTDFTAQAVLLTELARAMEPRDRGTIVAFSSIAGARVRRPNYVYGSAKAGLDGFCQGMQDALAPTGLRLLVVRPGFVIGRMTEGMSPAPMSSTPETVARATVAAISSDATDVWIPRKLGVLARILPLVPRWLWRRAPR
ncbi:SDR family NAD(P)-dependent oxidoreductase [Corynebacterium heidelbergense]|uniref:SDR family oxidoreductase n=1 Tax=Corynebacterium heidelbergense TaxID=2055947 RepID=A0A364VAB7_9CORY|nr:SDR family NAD(P)-dependent oxidoreductase [Corynebacterium heidelbergense]RAV33589.1 SDR family oxidoreductase [Corynebacterium heidelbergense]WCZ36518.1 putative oxidoreductase [Corynebacterium heidelbergense]